MAGAYAKISAHEDLCAERYKNIHTRFDMLFAILGSCALIAVAAGGWAFNKVWDAQQQQLAALRNVAAMSAPAALPHQP